ncbi:TetR/AcrR family transcriptional regulator [Catenuloplanes atrovinosus]|uniref:AcrR family transcriptional regulator n=1 Tax=Catenuloplanes atrovinosus TaxID=137266 RepID=A0AAE3YHG8_9ACTN|nr:helix-turn-helix domain-containing protein [Catenuloplanes atrovinosus]MDR7274013.1 AcrR family transcriptional regulator [Catenuloplanes atrovinosus]
MTAPTSRYRSPRREDSAAATRTAILDAARELFLERGYPAVTVPEIARAARVATQTVYASAGGKSGVLAALLQPLLDDDGAATANAEARRTTDPRAVIALAAAGTRRVHETYRELLHHLIRQAPGEPAAQLAVDDAVAKCRTGLAAIAGRLRELDGVRTDLPGDRLLDALYFYFGPDAWYGLVTTQGWPFDDAESWLRDAACRTLLRP